MKSRGLTAWMAGMKNKSAAIRFLLEAGCEHIEAVLVPMDYRVQALEAAEKGRPAPARRWPRARVAWRAGAPLMANEVQAWKQSLKRKSFLAVANSFGRTPEEMLLHCPALAGRYVRDMSRLEPLDVVVARASAITGQPVPLVIRAKQPFNKASLIALCLRCLWKPR